ncbi:MAG: hypothetical protein O7D30_10235 [Rickettsia endosymbiont of Ixodes persulcatus]|nr:hypothetical protein [Rickettsia endosymbiont of Ixodes persulcatus]
MISILMLNQNVKKLLIEHRLGCPHDGEGPPAHIENAPGAKSCPKSEGYLMGNIYTDMANEEG